MANPKKTTGNSENAEETIFLSLLAGDEGFKKFATDKIAKGELPMLDGKEAPEAGGGGEGKAAGKKPGSTFFKGNESEIKGIDSVDKFNAMVKEKFNIDVTDGYDTLLNSMNKFRSDSSKLTEAEKNLKGVKDAYAALPPAIKKSIEAVTNGQDYKKAFSLYASKLDFTKKAEDYNKEELASYYFPAKVTEAKAKLAEKKDDADAKDIYNQLVESYSEAAVSKFNAEQELFNSYKTKVETDNKNYIKAVEQSIDTTMSQLKQRFPLFDETKLETIKTHLESGPTSLFTKEDGTFNEDAAVKLALAVYGEEEINIAGKDGANDTALSIIDGANKKPVANATGSAPAGGGNENAAAKEFMEALGGRATDVYSVKQKT